MTHRPEGHVQKGPLPSLSRFERPTSVDQLTKTRCASTATTRYGKKGSQRTHAHFIAPTQKSKTRPCAASVFCQWPNQKEKAMKTQRLRVHPLTSTAALP